MKNNTVADLKAGGWEISSRRNSALSCTEMIATHMDTGEVAVLKRHSGDLAAILRAEKKGGV